MRIKQIITSSFIGHLHTRFRDKYKLKEYSSIHEPVVCFGFYPDFPTINRLLKHKSKVIVVWTGTDSVYSLKAEYGLAQIKRKRNISHISMSKDISKNLNKLGVKHREIHICPVFVDKFHPTELGKKIYIYGSPSDSPDFYQVNRSIEIAKSMGLEYTSKCCKGKNITSYDKMSDVYRECFVGLRLTPRDGLPNTVIEMGLMGRKCICNHELPNCIRWKTDKDIKKSIQSLIDSPYDINQIAKDVKEYISIGDDWLNV